METGTGGSQAPSGSPLGRIVSGGASVLARVRIMGIGRWLRMERDALAQTIKATVACAVGWWLAAYVLKVTLPVLVPVGVLLTVSATAYSTLVRGLQQVLAVLVGVTAAIALIWAIGANVMTMIVLVVAGLTLTRLLNLPAQNVQIPVTALLVVALGSTYGFTRLSDVLLGAGIGIAANLLVLPPRFVDKAGKEVGGLSAELADLAKDMAQGLRQGWDADMAMEWLKRARSLAQRLEDTEQSTERAAESVRLSPRRHRYARRLRQLAEAATCLDHAANQLRGIARGLVDLIGGVRGLPGAPGANLPESLADELAALSRVFRDFGLLQIGPGRREDLEDLFAALDEGQRFQHRMAGQVRRTEHPELASLQGSLLDDCARIRHEFNPDTGPHLAAFPQAAFPRAD